MFTFCDFADKIRTSRLNRGFKFSLESLSSSMSYRKAKFKRKVKEKFKNEIIPWLYSALSNYNICWNLQKMFDSFLSNISTLNSVIHLRNYSTLLMFQTYSFQSYIDKILDCTNMNIIKLSKCIEESKSKICFHRLMFHYF